MDKEHRINYENNYITTWQYYVMWHSKQIQDTYLNNIIANILHNSKSKNLFTADAKEIERKKMWWQLQTLEVMKKTEKIYFGHSHTTKLRFSDVFLGIFISFHKFDTKHFTFH